MRRTIIVAVVAVALLGGGSIALVWRMTLPSASAGRRAEASTAVAPSPPREAAASRAAAIADGLAPGYDPYVPLPGPAPRPGGRVLRKLTRKGPRPTASGGADSLAAAWSRIQSAIAPCIVRNAPQARAAEPGVQNAGGDPVLLIDLELRGGVTRIVDVSFASRGGLTDDAVGCAVKALRQHVLSTGVDTSTGGDEDGTRVQIPFTLRL